jgi:hypothetical protein
VTRTVAMFLVLASAAKAHSAEPPSRVGLPPPRTQGAVSVEAALQQRRSLRAPAAAPLSVEELGQLCRAAQGVTDEHGHRTAPSAHAAYPLQVYVLAGAVTGLPGGHLPLPPRRPRPRALPGG